MSQKQALQAEFFSAKQETKEKKRVSPRQSNHEEYTLPDCLAHLPAMPLYLSVAYFGLLTQLVLSRELICRAFHIDSRRALEMLRYLSSGTPNVTCECIPLTQGRGYCLRIVDIVSLSRPSGGENVPRTMAPPRGGKLKRENAQQSMRQWFLRRPNPQDVTDSPANPDVLPGEGERT